MTQAGTVHPVGWVTESGIILADYINNCTLLEEHMKRNVVMKREKAKHDRMLEIAIMISPKRERKLR